VNSWEEGFGETLRLHRLGLFEKLGRSFKTTNALENVNSLLGIYTDRVDYWKQSAKAPSFILSFTCSGAQCIYVLLLMSNVRCFLCGPKALQWLLANLNFQQACPSC
jgi:hypothetical protein